MKGILVALTVAAVYACGGSGGSGSTAPKQQPGNTTPPAGGISVTNDAFSPTTKAVTAGTTVKWAWNSWSGDPYYGGQTCASHSVTFDDGATSPTQGQGTFERTFNTAGTFNYHCMVHGAAMSGSITVQ